MRKTFTLLFTLLPFFFATSIYGQDFVRLTKSNYGESISIAADQVLEISLPRKASTGYIWCESASVEKTTVQSVARIGDDDFIHDSNPLTINGRIIAGQSGDQILRYVGASMGTTELKLELRRPWEKNGEVIDSYKVIIVSGGKYTGSYVPPVKEKPVHQTSTSKNLPSHFDWRPLCTPIADQQQCGDCWAFAGVGTFECNIKIVDGITRDISEAYLTNCDVTGALGCNGGLCPHDYWMAPLGAVYESDYPWTASLGSGVTGTCGGPFTYYETIDTFANVPGENAFFIPPDENIKSAIMNYGPVWVDVCAASSDWSNYSGGIFTESGLIFDHCVVLVGWCDSASISGGGYWILRNSWGPSWGIDGYMYLSYGSDVVGMFANYIVYKGGTYALSRAVVSNNENVHIYPNPATNNINIESQQQAIIEISNNQGQLIKTLVTSSNKTSIDISDFARGIYFIKVKTEKGVMVEKFIKE
jgi:predicted secreted protein